MWTPERVGTSIHWLPISLAGWAHRLRLSRLGLGLLVLGVADLIHHLSGADVDPLLLTIGGGGALWAARARRGATMLAGIVLAAVGLFAVLNDHAVFTRAEYALLLLVLAALILLMSSLPGSWRDPWLVAQAGVLLLVAVFALLGFAAALAAAPWAVGAPILVTVLGAALLLWNARGGTMP